MIRVTVTLVSPITVIIPVLVPELGDRDRGVEGPYTQRAWGAGAQCLPHGAILGSHGGAPRAGCWLGEPPRSPLVASRESQPGWLGARSGARVGLRGSCRVLTPEDLAAPPQIPAPAHAALGPCGGPASTGRDGRVDTAPAASAPREAQALAKMGWSCAPRWPPPGDLSRQPGHASCAKSPARSHPARKGPVRAFPWVLRRRGEEGPRVSYATLLSRSLWSVTLWSYRAAACPLLSPTGHVAPDSPCLLGVSPFKVTPPPVLPLPPRQRVWACVCVAGWSSQGPGPTGKACETHALYRASWAVPRGPDTGSAALSPV